MKISEDRDTPAGLAFAVSAYVIWGFLPLYMKLMDHIPAAEIVAHRVIWSVPIAGLILVSRVGLRTYGQRCLILACWLWDYLQRP